MNLGIALTLLMMIVCGDAFADDTDELKDALKDELKDEQKHERNDALKDEPASVTRLRLGARLMFDGASVARSDLPSFSTGELRRARVLLGADLTDSLRLTWSHEFAGDSPRAIEAALVKEFGGDTQLRAGLHQEPLGVDELTSSTSLRFMERSQANLFAPGYNEGISMNTRLGRCAVAGGLFASHVRQLFRVRGEERGLTARVACHVSPRRGTLVHLGTAATRRDVADDERLRFRPAKESRLADLDQIRTSSLRGVDEYVVTAGEMAVLWGDWLVLGEITTAQVNFRDSRPDATFAAWHLSVGGALWGGAQNYRRSRGIFFRQQEPGLSWALRRSAVDLDHGAIRGGRQSSTTVNLAWQATRHMQFQVEGGRTTASLRDQRFIADVIQGRWSISF